MPSIHADKYYPCELVGTWNTWYGEQDQAGTIATHIDLNTCSRFLLNCCLASMLIRHCQHSKTVAVSVLSQCYLIFNPVMNLLLGHAFLPLSSALVALQRWIPGANRGDEQAEAEQGTDLFRSFTLVYCHGSRS